MASPAWCLDCGEKASGGIWYTWKTAVKMVCVYLWIFTEFTEVTIAYSTNGTTIRVSRGFHHILPALLLTVQQLLGLQFQFYSSTIHLM